MNANGANEEAGQEIENGAEQQIDLPAEQNIESEEDEEDEQVEIDVEEAVRQILAHMNNVHTTVGDLGTRLDRLQPTVATMDTRVQNMRRTPGVNSALLPPPFHGTRDENITQWLIDLDAFLGFQEYTEVRKINVLPLLLKDRAKAFYQGLVEDRKNTYAIACASLREAYTVPEQNAIREAELFE